MKKYIDFVIKNYKMVIAIILLITIPLIYQTSKLEFNNSIDIYLNKDDPDVKYYDRFREIYGNEEFVMILFKEKNIFTNEILNIIREITDEFNRTKGVQRAFSITEQQEAVIIDDVSTLKRIIPEGELTVKELENIKKRVLQNKLLTQRLISEDGKTASIIIELKPIAVTQEKVEFVNKIKEKALEINNGRLDLYFSGMPYIEAEMNTLTARDFSIFIPIIVLIIFAITLLMLRNLTLDLLCMFSLLLITVYAVGFFAVYGETVNMVTSIMPPVLFAISVADSVHLLAHYKDEYINNSGNHNEAVKKSVKAVWLPCLFTSLTTAVGFFSFITASIRPIKILGIFTAIGVLTALFVTVTFLPALLIMFRRRFENADFRPAGQATEGLKSYEKESKFIQLLVATGKFSAKYYKIIFITFMSIIVLTFIGISKIKFETNLVNFFKDESRTKQDLNFIENNLGGIFPFETVIHARSREYDFTHIDSLKLINKIQTEFLKDRPEITSSLSIADYMKEMNRAFKSGTEKDYRIPDVRLDILDYYEFGNSDDTGRLISPDKMEARISFLCNAVSTEEGRKSIEEQSKRLEKLLGNKYTYEYTGQTPLWLSMEDNLRNSFISSFVFAFIIIFFMMYYICRNFKLTAVSMMPNLFPIFLTIGVMGWLDIPFDTQTIMIACITLGISVDDTVHYIVWYKRHIKEGMDIKPALIQTNKRVGKPIVITSIILFFGFFVLVFGSFKPTNTFGILAALAIIYALIADLLFLPALIMLFKL